MIYDCFLFYKELDLLELRLNILDPYVDRFVLIESDKSFTGRAKPLFFEENKERFAPFLDKIIHVPVLDDPPDCENAWVREKHQRNAIRRGLEGCQPDDCIVLSDVDEIPNPDLLTNLPDLSKPLRCRQLYFFYHLNNLNIDKPLWSGSRIFRFNYLENNTMQSLRKLPKSKCRVIGNGGWHFSFVGDVEFIEDKLRDFSHQEYNTPELNNRTTITSAIEKGLDVRGREYRFAHVRIDESYPKYLRDNLSLYAPLIGSFAEMHSLPPAEKYTKKSSLSKYLSAFLGIWK